MQTGRVPSSTLVRVTARWSLLLLALSVAWALTPHPVPLYDGIGFPDEPYRFVPARPGAAPATPAQVTLPVSGGVNVGGIIANSAEVGPQVSVYAPPRAFAAPGKAPVVVSARPVAPVPPLPAGRVDSNVYVLAFTSADGPVSLVKEAQTPAITMRSVSTTPAEPVFAYRPSPTASWQWLPTRRVGRDLSDAKAPGAGEYVLVLRSGAKAAGHTALYVVLGGVLLLVVGVIVGVRLMAKRSPEA